MMDLDRSYWQGRYTAGETGWDIGSPSTPLKEYFDQLKNKNLRILIPGGGRSYEAEYAHNLGFKNVFVIDLTDAPYADLLKRCPSFPKDHLIVGDFFEHKDKYDLIIEQTFFCALDPSLRGSYVDHMHRLLSPGGKLVGLLFNDVLNTDKPPFGGNAEVYMPLFRHKFVDVGMEPCYNSIPPRAGRELWLKAVRNADPVACSMYDRFEAASTLKQQVELQLRQGGTIQGRIVDLFIHSGVELMRLDDGSELALSDISEMRTVQHR